MVDKPRTVQYAHSIMRAAMIAGVAILVLSFAGPAARALEAVSLTADIAPGGMAAGEPAQFSVVVNILDGMHINSSRPSQSYLVATALDLQMPRGVRLVRIIYPPSILKSFSFSETQMDVYEGRVEIRVEVEVEPGAPVGDQRIRAALLYQACDDRACMAPSTAKLDIPVRILPLVAEADTGASPVPGGAAEEEPITTKLSAGNTPTVAYEYETAPVLAPATPRFNAVASIIERHGVFLSLFFVFWTGVLLNLTPCVYPMIPVTIAYFGSRARTGQSPRRAVTAYFLGIVLTYSLLGTIAGLTGSLFGAALQHPAMLTFLAIVMLYMAAGMFDWVPFMVPSAWLQSAGGRVPMGAFGMGATMGLVASPCVGPFLAGLLAYVGSRQSALIGFSLFFVLSCGMALPYVILGFFSDRIRSLPKAGEWMVVVKTVFGFVLLGMAVYFSAPLVSEHVERTLYGFVFAASGITAIYAGSVRGRAATLAGLVVGIGLLTTAFFVAGSSAPVSEDDDFWLPYDAVSFNSSLASGRPVLLDFHAKWCAPCRQMDRTTWVDARVRAALENAVRLKMDLTLYDSAESVEIRRQFAITGVPTVLYFDVNGREILRYEGFVSADEILGDLAGVR